MGFGLIHGGLHGGWCWDELRPYLSGPSVAVNLPGRDSKSDYASITYQDWSDSATQQVAGLLPRDLVLVAHSMGGISAPEVAKRLRSRVRGIVFLAAVVPPEGWSFERWSGTTIEGPIWSVPTEAARGFLCTGMSDAMADALLQRLNAEPAAVLRHPISRIGVPDVPVLYIQAEQDVTGLGPSEVERLALSFPRVQHVVVQGGHNVMMTQPEALAAVINKFTRSLR